MLNKKSALAAEFWETGRLPCRILDFHGHMDEQPQIYFPFCTADEMVRDMDRNGVARLIFCGHFALDEPINGEAYNVSAVRKYPDRLRAYHCIHSRHAHPDSDIAAVENNPDVYVGFKILGDYEKLPIDDPCNDPYYEYLNDTGKLLLIHTWGGSPYNDWTHVEHIASRFPNIRILCGHSFFGSHVEGVEATKRYPNVYYELTAIPITRGYLEDIVAGAGSERVLFGTDLPWFSTMHAVGMILGADITDEDRLNIFCRNGEKLYQHLGIR